MSIAIIFCTGFFLLNLILIGIVISILTQFPLEMNRLVEQDEYVIPYHTFTNTFGQVLTQGRYITPLGTDFYHYKRVLQNIELQQVKCMSRDKVIIDLHAVMQIQYDPNSLIPILMIQYEQEERYKSLLTSIIRSVILNTCLEWNVEQFYMERSHIDTSIYQNLIQNINVTSLGTQLIFFQLVDIKFPIEYSNLIKDKQNIEQNIQTALNDRMNQLTHSKTNILVNHKQAEITLINANKTSNIQLQNADMIAQQIQIIWETRAGTYGNIMKQLQLDAIVLIDYIKQEKIVTSPGAIINIDAV